MDSHEAGALDAETEAPAAAAEMSLDDFVAYARTLQSASCPACGVAQAGPDGSRCEKCSAPSLSDRLGAAGKLWRTIAYRLGIA